ncbi:flavodoxin [Erysipelothrix sp. HDW6A]|uniref:flavodoxin domain-containing protein n=1 Tax=Erysipelothrix sp. HDW6A TaxID=2714928 RepID=UPI00140A48DA|nr:flavodoxin domain-containing protein [Erysipelothrix sp. HDW6A]QIK57270.1 flavodoxin [Erysipelothrix sp. HDW6A]
MKPTIVYWTGSGNTQMIADAILEAVESLGYQAENHYVSDITADDVKDADFFYLGCPAMSGEDVEEYEFRPFLDDLKPSLVDKKVVLFGSYDWGDGEWMDNWTKEMTEAGANVVGKFQIQWEPSDEQLETVKSEVLKQLS